MVIAKKYQVTNIRTGEENIYDRKDFIRLYPETLILMETNNISKIVRDGEPNLPGLVFEKISIELNACQSCGAVAVVEVCGKTSDMCCMRHLHREYDGYVLRDMGVGEGDYLEFDFCVQCGQIQGEFPKKIHDALVTRDTKGYPYE